MEHTQPSLDATPMAPAVQLLDAGPVLGARTATGAKVWVRLDASRLDAANPTALRLELAAASGGAARVFDASASVEGDGTAVFRLEGLKPGQTHRYRITRAEEGAATLAEGSFATAPARMTRARIAFGADAAADAATDATIRAIEREHPDAFILFDDASLEGPISLAAQRSRHRALAKSPAFAELVAEVPLYSAWRGTASGTHVSENQRAETANRRRAFCEYHPNPAFGDGVEGTYSSFLLGSAEIFLLDASSFAQVDPSLLGETQWRWLEDSLSRSTAPFKVVALGCAWSGCSATQNALRRLAETIGRVHASGVVLVSTDGARARVLRHSTASAAGYDLLELIVGPLHAASGSEAAEVAPGVLFDRHAPQTFLILDLEEERTDGPELRAVFVDAKGDVIHAREAERSSLGSAR